MVTREQGGSVRLAGRSHRPMAVEAGAGTALFGNQEKQGLAAKAVTRARIADPTQGYAGVLVHDRVAVARLPRKDRTRTSPAIGATFADEPAATAKF